MGYEHQGVLKHFQSFYKGGFMYAPTQTGRIVKTSSSLCAHAQEVTVVAAKIMHKLGLKYNVILYTFNEMILHGNEL